MLKFIKQKAHLIGPFLSLLVYFLPLDLDPKQTHFLMIFIFVVGGWLFSNIPLYITGFIGVSLTAIFQIESAKTLLAYFAHPIVFLFLGGFLVAKAMNEEKLDKRFSLIILSQKIIGGSFNRMILAFLCITAFFSMWISNTATTAMMLPITLGTLTSLKIDDLKTTSLLLLGLAYSASIGGLGTPIGSTPNIIAIGMLKDLAGIEVSFFGWMLMGLPFVFVFITILYFYIIKLLPNNKLTFDNSHVLLELKKLPKISSREKTVLIIFVLLVNAWFLPSIIGTILEPASPILKSIKASFNSGVVALFFASLLFVFPLTSTKKILKQSSIKEIDWPSLLLFGSGLALGKTLFTTGLAKMAGDFFIHNLAGGSFFILLVVLVYITIFATELASNTATANILLPIVISMAITTGMSPTLQAAAVAFSCSLAFMLPVATPPNAIVYGSNKVCLSEMMKAGIVLNVVFGGILATALYMISLFS